MPICEYELCDKPISDKRLARHARFHSNLCRKRQWMLEDRRRLMSAASRDVVRAAMEWFDAGDVPWPKGDRKLCALYGACARYQRHDQEQLDEKRKETP